MGARLTLLAGGEVEVARGDDALRAQRARALERHLLERQVRPVLVEPGARVGQIGRRAVDLHLEGARVDLGEELAALDRAVEVDGDHLDRAGDVSADLHGLDGVHAPGRGHARRDRPPFDRHGHVRAAAAVVPRARGHEVDAEQHGQTERERKPAHRRRS